MVTAIEQFPVFEKGSSSSQYQQISNFCVNYLENLLVDLMHLEIPDELSAKPEIYQNLQQTLLKRERTVRHAFQFQVEKLFSDFKSIRRTRLHSNRSSDWLSLGLTGHNSSKVQKSIEQIQEKYEKHFDRILLNQGRRLKTLVHRSDDNLGDNPITPGNLANAFLASIEALNLTANKTCQLFELFDSILGIQLLDFYVQIDQGLYNLNILPELTDTALYIDPADDSVSPVDNPEAPQEDDFDNTLIRFMNHELDVRSDLGDKKKDALVQSGVILTNLRKATAKGTLEYAHHYDQLETDIEHLLVGNQFSELKKFTYFYRRLLDNPLVNSPLKKELSRLSYPLIELVLVDPFFFRSSAHPVNDFIHSMVDFEIRYRHREAHLKKVHKLFSGLLKKKKPVLSDFIPMVETYESYKESSIRKIQERREKRKAEDDALKDRILQQINDITSALVVEEATLAFFYDDWQLLLKQLARKLGEESSEFEQALEIAKMLAWSLNENRDTSNKKYQKQSFTQLLKAIEKGLIAVNFPSQHRHRVRKQLVKDFKQNNEQTRIELIHSSGIKVSSAINQFTNNITRKTSELTDIKVRSTPVADTSHLSAKGLTVGTWVEIKQDDGKTVKRAKLKWKSEERDLYIFIDQRGHKLKEINASELDQDLHNGLITPLTAPSLSGLAKPMLGSGYRCFA
ncbi:MAG: DUF1631 family protein [Gammaproteobacteria bacterium]|nr:DUF1631 family protein [Gammaproteobacteria bacterium]